MQPYRSCKGPLDANNKHYKVMEKQKERKIKQLILSTC